MLIISLRGCIFKKNLIYFVNDIIKFLRKLPKISLLIITILLQQIAKSQLIVGETDPIILVSNVLVGKGQNIKISNIQYTGYNRASGFFENGKSTKLNMEAGIILSSGVAIGAKGPNNNPSKTSFETGSNMPGSALLDVFAVGKTFDAVILQFDFVPQTEEIVFNYVFASEEYLEYVDQNFSDIFGFFISGPGISGEQNVALVPGTNLPVCIDNINHLRNTSYFINNPNGEKTLQADGLTKILTATLKLVPCQTYTIKLAVADVNDRLLDTYVFIESGSFKHKTNMGRDTFICKDGFDVELDAGNYTRKVKWTCKDPKITITDDTAHKIRVNAYGEYCVEVFTDCGSFINCKKILPGVANISIGNDTLFCGDTLSKTLTVANRVFDSYLWSDSSTDPELVVNKKGLYWLEVNNGGCIKRDSVFIDLQPLPKIDLGNDTIVCGDFDLIIGTNTIADRYLWNTGDTLSRIHINKGGKYILKVEERTCKAIDSIIVTKRNKFNLNIGSPRTEICNNDTLTLRTGIYDTLNFITKWNNGSSNPSITINQTGRYTVWVKDKLCNFIAYDSMDVDVYKGLGNVWVPNAFTPDNNLLNDVFKPVSDISTFNYYKFAIFDRWGQKIFESTNPQSGWDGFINNKLSPNDVYIWTLYIKSNCSNGNINFLKGVVHLVR
ncbi:MAG: gliding motility-associated C-terminal domain-containing protein [Bacteroidetes bacterium]|nr:gliding motility-associated C-terminal domain-containing protein [Bacteroidota bacterium]